MLFLMQPLIEEKLIWIGDEGVQTVPAFFRHLIIFCAAVTLMLLQSQCHIACTSIVDD